MLDPSLVHLIKSVSLEEHNRQADNEKVKPWLKFLWEAYRSVLEIIRSTPKLEQLYKVDIASFLLFNLHRKQRRRLSIIALSTVES